MLQFSDHSCSSNSEQRIFKLGPPVPNHFTNLILQLLITETFIWANSWGSQSIVGLGFECVNQNTYLKKMSILKILREANIGKVYLYTMGDNNVMDYIPSKSL